LFLSNTFEVRNIFFKSTHWLVLLLLPVSFWSLMHLYFVVLLASKCTSLWFLSRWYLNLFCCLQTWYTGPSSVTSRKIRS
jgi:hypothetical protein